MASLLLIGGTGFFGKSFLDSFQRGRLDQWGVDRVIAMARHADELRSKVPKLIDRRVELVNADIGTVEYLPFADYVIHAAASTDARNYLKKPESERENIQAGIYNYCGLAPKYHVKSQIVYVSSGAVYGVQPTSIPFLREDSINLNLEGMPEYKKDYAVAKRDAENAVQLLCRKQGLRANIARCFSFVGPWLPRDQHFAIGNFIKDGLEGKPIKVNATSPVYRSYMHADDMVKWLMMIASSANEECDVFNVGSDEVVSVKELAKMIAEMFSVGTEFAFENEGAVDRYIPSVEKARSLLGLDLEHNLLSSLTVTVDRIREEKNIIT